MGRGGNAAAPKKAKRGKDQADKPIPVKRAVKEEEKKADLFNYKDEPEDGEEPEESPQPQESRIPRKSNLTDEER